MPKILLFIPAYNCEKQIVRVLAQLKYGALDYIREVLVVNNISTDNTQQVAIDYAKAEGLPVTVIKNHQNYNLGGSHKVAFDYSINNGYDYTVILHGDDQGSIADILPLLKSGEYKNYDCCLGARFLADSKLIGYSKFRTFGNKVYNALFSMVVKTKLYDLGSGLNMYNNNMLKSRFYYKFPDQLTFNYCMVLALNYYNQKAMFFPITWREDDQVSNVKLTSQALSVVGILRKYAFNKEYIKSEFRQNPIDSYGGEVVYTNMGAQPNTQESNTQSEGNHEKG